MTVTATQTVTLGAETPEFSGAAMRALASGWRAAGIVGIRSGRRLTFGRITTQTGDPRIIQLGVKYAF